MQNQVTVIPADKVISVNGRGLNFNFPAPANMHALQWRGAAGHIEYTDGAPNRLLAAADYAAEVAPFAALWQAEYDRLEAEKNRPLTPEELHAIAAADAAAESAAILTARMQREMVQTVDFTAVEFATFALAGLFPAWAPGEAYVTGDRLVHEGVVYEVQQAVTAQAHQTPRSAGMLAVYRPISADPDTGAEPDGSRENPYSFIYGMDVSTSKYYIFKGKLYLAKADMKPCVWNPGTPGLWQWELAV